MIVTRKRAFSLIEILIALAIAGLAASLVVPVVMQNQDKAKHKVSMLNLNEVGKAMEKHYLEKGVFPVFKNWPEVAAEESPLREYLNEIPATDSFGKEYNVEESTEKGYIFQGWAIEGKLGKEYPDYSVRTGAKLKLKNQKE
jgi:prepilin-type N-terminal cleavage/methylation domain-containing protein